MGEEEPTVTVVVDEADQARVSVTRWGDGPASLVFLHDGLGSAAQWRSLPARTAQALGRPVAAIDRPGHGASRPTPVGPWPPDWLQIEADRLGRLLPGIAAERPVLVGHSDGGSIALLHARSGGGSNLGGVVTLAAHSWVEDRCVEAIEAMVATRDSVVAALGRTHDRPGPLFDAWSGVWLSPAFRTWDIRPDLAAITCPVTVVQGTDDEYATEAHLHRTTEAVGANARSVLVDGVGHLLHHQDPDRVVEIIGRSVHAWEETSHA